MVGVAASRSPGRSSSDYAPLVRMRHDIRLVIRRLKEPIRDGTL
jgi:hypothetical protein